MKFYYTILLFQSLLPVNILGQVEKAKQFLERYNKDFLREKQKFLQIKYQMYYNTTEYNKLQLEKAELRYEQVVNTYRKEASLINLTGLDEVSKRQFKFILTTKVSNNSFVNNNLMSLRNKMGETYRKGSVKYDSDKIKMFSNPSDFSFWQIISSSNDSEELHYVWHEYRNSIGPNIRNDFKEFIRLNNIGAKQNGYKDAGEFNRKKYEVDDLEALTENIWLQLKPFYDEFHAYVRFKLKKIYPDLIDEGLPAQLLGNMLGSTWEGISQNTIPYPALEKGETDPIKENMTSLDMFKTAEDFFVSMGWPRLPETFWNESMFEKAKDRNVTCMDSAWDMLGLKNKMKDLRIFMCTTPNIYNFITVHHELGHIYYALFYWDHPLQFREGANPGFHEAVGDTLSLSVMTQKHMHKIKLLDKLKEGREFDINYLYKIAMITLPFIPFVYISDKWMWDVYSGKITPETYNSAWWEYRLKYQGVTPPNNRGEEHFDVSAQYHVTADVPMIRYFYAMVLQFQFYKQACKAAKHEGDLFKCTLYQSKEAGTQFRNMLSMGRSEHWSKVLKNFTGSEKISTEPILEYFQPLRDWFKEQQAIYKYPVGWNNSFATTINAAPSFFLISFVITIINGFVV